RDRPPRRFPRRPRSATTPKAAWFLSWHLLPFLCQGILADLRNAVGGEKPLHLPAVPFERRLQAIPEGGVVLPHPHGDGKREGKPVALERDDAHRPVLAGREIGPDGTPGDGEIDLACRRRLDESGRRVGLAVVAIDGIAD